jgi:hypothetical protein
MGRPRGKKIRHTLTYIDQERLVSLCARIRIADDEAKLMLGEAILAQRKLLASLDAEVSRLVSNNRTPSEHLAKSVTSCSIALMKLLIQAGMTDMMPHEVDEL